MNNHTRNQFHQSTSKPPPKRKSSNLFQQSEVHAHSNAVNSRRQSEVHAHSNAVNSRWLTRTPLTDVTNVPVERVPKHNYKRLLLEEPLGVKKSDEVIHSSYYRDKGKSATPLPNSENSPPYLSQPLSSCVSAVALQSSQPAHRHNYKRLLQEPAIVVDNATKATDKTNLINKGKSVSGLPTFTPTCYELPFSSSSSSATLLDNCLPPPIKAKCTVRRFNTNEIPKFDLDTDETECLTAVQSVFGISKRHAVNVENKNTLDAEIINDLKDLLDHSNPLVQTYHIARDRLNETGQKNVHIRLIGRRQTDGRTHNLPTASEVAAIVVGDIDKLFDKRDIIGETQTGHLKRISELHPSYLPLQYPLIFPTAEDGYRTGLKHGMLQDNAEGSRTDVTMREFFAYKIQDRDVVFSLLLNARRLFQQFLVDVMRVNAYTMVESERLFFIRRQQTKLRCDSYKNISASIASGNTDASNTDQRVLLPSSFTGGSSYLYSRISKHGLPHAHICLFLESSYKFPSSEYVDRVICAEIPDNAVDPELYQLVKEFMIHEHTSVNDEGCPVYRRRDTSHFVIKSGIPLNNGYVVPYNGFLLRKYQAHINVEWCNQSGAIKYLFKYINKGPDRVTIAVNNENSAEANVNDQNDQPNVDEIEQFYDCRYIFACEAAWRLFKYDIHYRFHAVERLPFHLLNEQYVTYEDDSDLCDVINKPSVGTSMFLGWMERNKNDPKARELTYVQFPMFYVWNSKHRRLVGRQKRGSVGRIHYVPPSLGECYYLRILLNKVIGPTSFEDIRIVNGQVYPSYEEACFALGLLDDDKEYVSCIKEANAWASGRYVRSLFVMLLLSNSLSRPASVWCQTWEDMSDDILHTQRIRTKNPVLTLQPEEIKNHALADIEWLLRNNGSTLANFPDMPSPDQRYVISSSNLLVHQELLYNKDLLQDEHGTLLSSLTSEQSCVYETVMAAVEHQHGGMFFVYGYGGTGKTFIWKTLSAALRSKGNIVLNVASSGIASLLLSGGRTAHSRFIIPINVNEDSVCSIQPNGDLAQLLRMTKLIIWDEAPMTHRHCFEALD
ncbi:uncharacterized protein LOC110923956 [Helianthus annuus]|uniref:uncharacterized protein LOC110923956 n=1 Tax=Helianthus annuus TaxID=4232 RepID=UPI000B8F4A1D|nr:uncharacterized protein LOC110923956 [Helianthus annuus]